LAPLFDAGMSVAMRNANVYFDMTDTSAEAIERHSKS
jgi:hypothetical protein